MYNIKLNTTILSFSIRHITRMNRTLSVKSNKSNLSSQFNTPGSSTVENTPNEILQLPKESCFERRLPPQKKSPFRQSVNLCLALLKKPGVHSTIALSSDGFYYTGNGDTARCDDCNLEVSRWTSEMKPIVIHAQRSPECPFVHSIRPIDGPIIPATLSRTSVISTSNDGERPFKRQKTKTTDGKYRSPSLVKVEILKQIRCRTFSHWPHQVSPSSSQMIKAGYFNCNVGDRVICIYCNQICQ
jgi:hypothetical protein